MISPDDAVQDLYRIAVVEGRTTSTVRLKMLADYCVQELEQRGLNGVEKEVAIPTRIFCSSARQRPTT